MKFRALFIRFLVLFAGFILGCWLFFPLQEINRALTNQANKYLPREIKVEKIEMRSPLTYFAAVGFPTESWLKKQPLEVNIVPGWFDPGIEVKLENQPVGSVMSANLRTREVLVHASGLALDQFVSGFEGTADLSGKVEPGAGVKGEFTLSGRAASLESISYLPTMVRNQSVDRIEVEGRIVDNLIKIEELILRTPVVRLTASGQVRVKFPPGSSYLNLEVELLSPVEKRFKISTPLRLLQQSLLEVF